MLRKKSEKCIAFLVPSLHRKLALFRVPYALRAIFIPSLRFGTGYASPYNPCHCLKLKNSKLNLIKSMFQTSRIFTEEMREVFKHDKRFIQLGMKQSCSARGVCWDTASMESANGVLKTECLYKVCKIKV